MMQAATSKVENSGRGSSCKLKFIHAECHYTIITIIIQVFMLRVVMLRIFMLSVFMLSVFMLSVLAPFKGPCQAKMDINLKLI